MKKLLITLMAAGLFAGTAAKAQDIIDQIKNDLSSDEQALFDKGSVMEAFSPDEHSSHTIVHITATKHGENGKEHTIDNPQPILCLTWGIEDATPARAEGKSMAEFRYSPAQAEQFLFAEGWDKYHDRFFTRAYVQEGSEAYNKARRKHK
jgi:hypothetical protein